MLQSDRDWTPSLRVGHREERRHTESLLPSNQPERHREEQRWTTKTRPSHASMRPRTESAAAGTPAVRPWKDIRSLLQSVLQRQTNINQPSEDRTREKPVKESHLGFRDFFRDSLQASLEASSRSRALSARPPSISEEYKVELSVEVPSLKEQRPASSSCSSSSSSCLNCVRLQRRIVELQEKLSHLTGEEEDTEAVLISDSVQSGEALQRAVRLDKEPVWTEPLSPLEWALHVGVQDRDSSSDSDSADESSSSGSEVFHDVLETHISSGKPRPPPRFQKVWLTKFPFLRYSPSLNQMWCRVCRLYADTSHHNLAMIKGSSKFRFHNIKMHGSSNYHAENMERHLRCHRLVKERRAGKPHHRASSETPQTPKM